MKRNLRDVLLSVLFFVAAWPEHGFPFLIFVAWVPLLMLSDRFSERPSRGFFLYVYAVFFLFNLLITYWIWFATPIGAVFAVTVNALLMSLTFWIWHRSRRRLPPSMYWPFFVTLWMSFEMLHYHWDFEWPWLTMGNVFAAWPSVIQWYEYTGVFGGSLWVLTGSVLLYFLVKNPSGKKYWIRAALWLILPVLLSLRMYSAYREKGKEAKVLILQPNIDPWTEKFDRSNVASADDLIALMEQAKEKPDLAVAPETALAQSMQADRLGVYPSVRKLKKYLSEKGFALLTGVSLHRFYYDKNNLPSTVNKVGGKNLWYTLYNSALLIEPDGKLMLYHKSILVPGAEKMPYFHLLKPVFGSLVLDLGGMAGTHTPDSIPKVFPVEGTPVRVAPIICYESIFGFYVRKYIRRGANLPAIITNDGWWKKTGGYRQHFRYASLRAIETRRDIVRSANTGRSGIFDQKGRVLQSLPYGKRGIIEGTVHLNDEETFYVRYGDYPGRLAVFLAVLFFLYSIGSKRIRLTF